MKLVCGFGFGQFVLWFGVGELGILGFWLFGHVYFITWSEVDTFMIIHRNRLRSDFDIDKLVIIGVGDSTFSNIWLLVLSELFYLLGLLLCYSKYFFDVGLGFFEIFFVDFNVPDGVEFSGGVAESGGYFGLLGGGLNCLLPLVVLFLLDWGLFND